MPAIGAADAVLILPDLGDLFKFKDLGFADIVQSIRLGIGFIGPVRGSALLQ